MEGQREGQMEGQRDGQRDGRIDDADDASDRQNEGCTVVKRGRVKSGVEHSHPFDDQL